MSANIDTMMYAGERPWHGLGVAVQGEQTAESAIVKAGLNWNVQRYPVYFGRGQGNSMPLIENKRAIVREDTGAVFSVMGEGYTPVQNREAFRFFDAIVGEGQAIYHTAGALGQGEKVWILAKLPGDIVVNDKDRTEKFLLLSNAHDGTQALRMFFTPVRVVCQNTLNLAQSGRGKGEGINIRHTVGATDAIKEARRALGIAVKFYDGLGDTISKLANVKASRDAVASYFKTLVPDNVDAERNSRTVNIRETLAHHFLAGRGNKGETWWDALNAVTEYVDHDRSTRGTGREKASNRLESQWFGSGARLKAEAWSLALDGAGVKV